MTGRCIFVAFLGHEEGPRHRHWSPHSRTDHPDGPRWFASTDRYAGRQAFLLWRSAFHCKNPFLFYFFHGSCQRSYGILIFLIFSQTVGFGGLFQYGSIGGCWERGIPPHPRLVHGELQEPRCTLWKDQRKVWIINLIQIWINFKFLSFMTGTIRIGKKCATRWIWTRTSPSPWRRRKSQRKPPSLWRMRKKKRRKRIRRR